MHPQSSTLFASVRPAVVATIGSQAAWKKAEALQSGEVDFLEVRADLLLQESPALPGQFSDLPLPVILTVRGPAEGGKASPNATERIALYRRFSEQAVAIDLELASAHEMKELVDATQSAGRQCIFSHHDFVGTSTLEALRALTHKAAEAGADLFKVATTTRDASDLGILCSWLESEEKLPLAAMGMGRLGKVSRPLLAQLGSRLNYGYLDTPVVPGQWPALELRRFLDTLT